MKHLPDFTVLIIIQLSDWKISSIRNKKYKLLITYFNVLQSLTKVILKSENLNEYLIIGSFFINLIIIYVL